MMGWRNKSRNSARFSVAELTNEIMGLMSKVGKIKPIDLAIIESRQAGNRKCILKYYKSF